MKSERSTYSAAKNQAILDAALSTFIQCGFGGAKMDDIADAAGVSKQTIYTHFGSKEKLFIHILEALFSRFVSLFKEKIAANSTDYYASLVASFTDILFQLCSPEKLAISRLIYSEAKHCPELGQHNVHMMDSCQKLLALYLEEVSAAGILSIDQHPQAADDLISLIKGQFYFRALASDDFFCTYDDVQKHVRHAVDIFFKAYQAECSEERATLL